MREKNYARARKVSVQQNTERFLFWAGSSQYLIQAIFY